MKFALISLVTLTLASAGVLADPCTCIDTDTQCWSKCVTDTNSCITNCQNDITCYENCINDGWPGIVASSSADISPTAIASSSADHTVIKTSSAIPTSLEGSSTQVTAPIPSDIQSSLSQTLSSALPSTTVSVQVSSNAIPSVLSSLINHASYMAAASTIESTSAMSESAGIITSSVATSTPEPTTNSASAVYIPSNVVITLVAASFALICLY